MTTLYRPVKIETFEQAEALPVGTIALLPIDRSHRQVLTKTTDRGPGPWELDMHGYGNGQVIGWTALVPIEAAEQWGVEVREGGDPDDVYVIRAVDRENAEWRISTLDIPWTRIVRRIGSTPWEAAR